MPDEENARKAANLLTWRESGRGPAWVIGHDGQWNHDDWTRLLDDLKASDFWPLDPDAVGRLLEEWKLAYHTTPLRLFANAPWAMTKNLLRKAARPFYGALAILVPCVLILGYLEMPDVGGPFAEAPGPANAFERVKFEVDYIKHLATMCAAAIAFIAGYLKNQEDKPPAWMTSSALASFIVAACMCSLGYMLKTYWVIEQAKPLWQLYLDRVFGLVTDVAFIFGIAVTVAMCLRPLWQSGKSETSL